VASKISIVMMMMHNRRRKNSKNVLIILSAWCTIYYDALLTREAGDEFVADGTLVFTFVSGEI
jgi:hypothetical protein